MVYGMQDTIDKLGAEGVSWKQVGQLLGTRGEELPVVIQVTDANFQSFISDSFYSAVGFYHPGAKNKDEMLAAMEKFAAQYGNVASATMDITGQSVPGEFGISEEESPIVVVFKQGNPIKAINVFTVEAMAAAIAPPGKNITLQ